MSSKSTNMRAILSVSDKAGLVELGRGLAALGVELVSTGGTATALAAAGLAVVGVSDVTGFPEMMDGRVKTLHPAIHAGILARRSRPDDLEAIARHGITPVDLVVVNLYPFAKAAQNPATPFDALVEEIDIGARAWSAPRPRTSATCWWSWILPTTPGSSSSWHVQAGLSPRFASS